ncbi:uncharacterized protein LOC115924781 [Strongylocentrotus purpuratus]|uniref:Uncharacterized protein n=1 Tax=Strongylocentrotus purpuratus TaxID=7668 RepID=A0A7M7SZV5_STRPU|nr:uncharacterized protein LOC115924781 [Strongylocentrotus purpuratus]
MNVSNSLFEVICRWRIKQKDGTNYKRLLAEKLRSVHLDTLATKLVKGGYSSQDTPTQSLFTDEVHPVNKLTQEEDKWCGKDFMTFYCTVMYKIKTGPLEFHSVKEFENIYKKISTASKQD